MNKLVSRMKKESNKTFTENGAETYRSTLNDVLDFFYLAPTRQGQDNTDLFIRAFEDDPALAMKCAFYIRDVRGGKGQKKTFQDILAYLARHNKKLFDKVVGYVPEYGYWKDILSFVNYKSVQSAVKGQLAIDLEAEHPSLLAKWMPSENASSRETKELARSWAEVLGLRVSNYRKMLSDLRARIGVVETSMSADEWSSINYSHVPSRAMKLYRKAFEKHDEDRFSAFIDRALTGEEKIQSSNVYPHEIVAEFLHGSGTDKTLEAMWKQLPNYFGDEERNVLVVVDVSGSMEAVISGKVQSIDVSVGLGLYCAERNQGAFHNVLMTFSTDPAFVEVRGKSLRSRIQETKSMNWGMSTDIQAVFQKLLSVAKKEHVSEDEMPSIVLIISDMEFNSCVHGGTNLDGIRAQYRAAGYELPLLTFWNVNARGNQVPATRQEKGVFLVSGFSAETVGKVLNAESVTPEALMLEVLNSDRYAFVDELGL